MAATRARYIVIEGIDGSGKSTVARALADVMKARLVSEPSSPLTEPAIRELASDLGPTTRAKKAMALLFAADRMLLHDSIEATLVAGQSVVSDRSYLSSLVYQPDQDVPTMWVLGLQTGILVPDRIIYLRVKLETALARLAARGGPGDVFERRAMIERNIARYEAMIERDTRRLRVVSGEGPKLDVLGRVLNLLYPI